MVELDVFVSCFCYLSQVYVFPHKMVRSSVSKITNNKLNIFRKGQLFAKKRWVNSIEHN